MAVLLDRGFPDSFQLLSIDSLPSRFAHLKVTQNANMQLVVAVRQGTITLASHHPNRQLAALFREIYEELEFRLSYFQPCVLLGIEHDVQVVRDYEVWIRLTASAIGQAVHLPESRLASQQNLFLSTSNLLKSLPPIPKEEVDNMESSVESFGTPPNESRTTMSSLAADSSVDNAVDAALSDAAEDMAKFLGTHSGPKAPTQEQGPERAGPPTPLVPLGTLHGLEPHSNFDAVVPAISTISAPSHVRFVEVTPLSQIPGCTVTKYLGVLSFHFVKESYLDYDDVDLTKGMGGFAHGFLGEILAVARAHCAALGGNAVLTFRIDQAVFSENVKSTGYAVVTCSGDVVHVVPDWPGSLSTAGFREPLTGGLDLRFLSSGVAQAEQDPLMWTLDLRMALDP